MTVVVFELILLALIGVVLLRPELISSLLGHDLSSHISTHFRLPHHRVHDLTFGFIVATGGVGMLAQLRAPSKNIAAQWMALVPWLALSAVSAVTGHFVFAPLPVLAALTTFAVLLHPARCEMLNAFDPSRTNRAMLALAGIAAVPLLLFAVMNVQRQMSAANDHAALGHYGFMAAFAVTAIGTALIACLRPTGWRLTATVTGLLPALLGLASLLYPANDSSLAGIWAVVAIAWGIAFATASRRAA